MRAMNAGNSYHLRPHCTKRAASATTCARAASAGPSRSDGAAGENLGAALPAGFLTAGLAGTAALRSVRATCAVPVGGGARLAARNFGISRVAVTPLVLIVAVSPG